MFGLGGQPQAPFAASPAGPMMQRPDLQPPPSYAGSPIEARPPMPMPAPMPTQPPLNGAPIRAQPPVMPTPQPMTPTPAMAPSQPQMAQQLTQALTPPRQFNGAPVMARPFLR